MANSDFCFVPLGQAEGDSDRYVPALLYGCIPVFSTLGEGLPFDDLIKWSDFSLILPNGAHDPPKLHQHLRNVSDSQLVSMRTAMASAWPRILWTSAMAWNGRNGPRSYLGESASGDAFHALISVLRKRLGLPIRE